MKTSAEKLSHHYWAFREDTQSGDSKKNSFNLLKLVWVVPCRLKPENFRIHVSTLLRLFSLHGHSCFGLCLVLNLCLFLRTYPIAESL